MSRKKKNRGASASAQKARPAQKAQPARGSPSDGSPARLSGRPSLFIVSPRLTAGRSGWAITAGIVGSCQTRRMQPRFEASETLPRAGDRSMMGEPTGKAVAPAWHRYGRGDRLQQEVLPHEKELDYPRVRQQHANL